MDDMEVICDDGSSLSLPERFQNQPLTALRVSARRVLALYLDVESEVIDEETGQVSDFNGLAELIGFKYVEIKWFEKQKSPTKEILEAWERNEDGNLDPSIGKLWLYLMKLGRFDVMKEIKFAIEKDVAAYEKNLDRQKNLPIQSDVVSTTDHGVDETLILSIDDVNCGYPQYYDAYISCAQKGEKDNQFVMKMIEILEKKHGFRLFVPERNGLPGPTQSVADATLIESRCKRMLIILSHTYLKSPQCEFQVKFAHSLSPGARSKRLIPVLIEPMESTPQILRHVTLCDYTRQDLHEWFWERLAAAIRQPLDPANWSQGHTDKYPQEWLKPSGFPVSSCSQSSSPMATSSSSSSSFSSSYPGISAMLGHQNSTSSLPSAASSDQQDSGVALCKSMETGTVSLNDSTTESCKSGMKKSKSGNFFKRFKDRVSKH